MRRPYMVVLVLATFFVISFLTNIIGPLVPEIIEAFDLSLTLVAVLPFSFFIAYGVFSIPAGLLVERYGERRMMVAAFGVAFAGALFLALVPQYGTAIVSLFLIGAGMATLQVVINPLLRAAGGEEHFAFNSVLGQLFFGVASFLSPLVYSALVLRLRRPATGSEPIIGLFRGIVPAGLPWVSLYWIFAVVSLVMVVIILLVRFPAVELKEEERMGTLATNRLLLKNPTVWLFFLGIASYVGSEQGVTNWISSFLSTYHGYDPQTIGAQTISWFWGLMTAGTLLGLVFLKLVDSRKVLIGFTLAALVCLTAALFGPGAVARIAFPLIGFFASVMWPIIISLGLNSVAAHHGSVSGIFITGIAGGAVVPLIVGVLGDQFGLRIGMLFLYVTLGYILSIGVWARPLVTNQTVDLRKKRATT